MAVSFFLLQAVAEGQPQVSRLRCVSFAADIDTSSIYAISST